jgi:hypothetical protein
MADVVDDFGRVTRLKADFESLSESLRSAVGKAVEYATGNAKENTDDLKKEFEKLVDAMEELGEDVKDSLKSTKDFVEEVKRAAESVEKARASKATGGRDTLADAQREQTRILQQILAAQQKAISEKAAKFTTGGTTLSSPTTRKPALKEMGFRPRGADKIPAMVSPGEFVVSKRGAMGNEPLLDRINRGYVRGGKVKPEYLAGGSSVMGAGTWNGRRYTIVDRGGKPVIIVEGALSNKSQEEILKDFSHLGEEVSVEFSRKFDENLRETAAKWFTSMGAAFTGRGDPFQVLFEGAVKDVTEFRREMRNLAFQTEGITGNFREAQAEFAKIGTDIASRTGTNVTAFQKAYMNNARKGFKDQKAGMKVLEAGLQLSTMIGSETQATAGIFAEWHRELGLSSIQMEKMATDMRSVALSTGVAGDELINAMKSSDGILKNLRNQGTLTSNVAKSVVTMMAEAQKTGYGESTNKILTALSSHSGMMSADSSTQALLYSVANRMGGGATREMLTGNFMRSRENLAGFATNMKDMVGGLIGKKGADLDFSKLTDQERDLLAMRLRAYGIEIGEAENLIKTTEKASKGLRGTMDDLDKIAASEFATEEEKKLAEKKRNDALLGASMDFLSGVRDKTGDQSLAEAMAGLSDSKDFANQRQDFAAMASALTPAMMSQFGLGGSKEEMSAQMANMSVQKQTELSSLIAADQLMKAAKAQGRSVKNFGPEMQAALAKGDTKRFNELRDEMQGEFSKIGVADATNVDPMEALEQSMDELNETIRNAFSPLTGAVLDLIGWIGLVGVQIGMMGGSLYNIFGGPFVQWLMGGGFGSGIVSGIGGAFATALAPAMLLLGGIKGAMEAESAKRTRLEGSILGALTGGAKTGSFITGRYGDQATAGDKALGVAGAAAWGAAAGAGISASIGFADGGLSILLGAIIGAFVEVIKIVTEGTDILQDILKPFQVVVDYVYETFKNIYEVIAGIFTLDIGRVFGAVFNQLGSSIAILPRLVLGIIQAVVIGLPKLILRSLWMLWHIPKMIMDSIKSGLASMVDNSWLGPIFKVFSDAFNAIYDGFMAIWTPIADIFSGLYTVFNDLGKALFGAGEGGGILAGLMWVLQKAVYAVAYVISWILVPLKLLAWALGFVMKIVGNLIAAIIKPFQYLYDVLVGHSIVPDLIFGIIEFFAMLPLKIFSFLLQIPIMLGKALLNIPAMIGRAFMATGSILGSFGQSLIRSFKKLPKMFFNGMKAVFFDFPSWLMGKLMDGIWAVGNFLVITLPQIMWQAFKDSMSAVGKFVLDTLTWPFRKIWEFMEWAWNSIKQKISEAYEFIKSMFDPGAWASWISDLGTYVYEGFKSAMQGIWDWIKSWIPGLGTVSKAWDKTKEVAGNAWSTTKETAGKAWEGAKYAASYLNPFSYFKEGTKKIEKPGLGMLHAGEMIVPANIVNKIAAVGSGAFGSLSSFVMGKRNEEGSREGGLVSSLMSLFKGGGGEESGSVLSSLSDRVKGMGDFFKGCCPGEAVEGADAALKDIPDAVAEALGKTDTDSFFGRINKRFKDVGLKADKFFKPMTTGFLRARKRGDGFFASMTRGMKAQYMSATRGGEGEGGLLSRGMDWINKSIFGQQEGRDTKKGIFQRIKEGIFGSKEGDETKKGILDIIKSGLFGDGGDVKKGLFQIASEGLFGKKGESGGLFGWFKSKIFGNKVEKGQEGPSKPGLADAAKNTANSLWNSFKKRIEYNAEDGVIGGAKKAAVGMYGKAKEMVFGQKMAEGEIGPAKPGLLTRAKSKLKGIYGKTKGMIFGNPEGKAAEAAGNALDSAGKADSKVSGSMEGFKEKLKNIADGIKEFSGTKVLAGAINLIPSSVGLVAMIPGSLGARMIQGIDGKRLESSLKGLGKGVATLGNAKVLLGAAAMVAVGIGSLGLMPAVPILALLGVVGPLVEAGLKALGKGLSAFGKAAANPYTWLGVLLLAALNVALIPLAYALSLLSPLVEAFGKAIKSAFEGMGELIKSAAEGIVSIMKEITPGRALGLFVAAGGIAALGVAMAAFAAGKFVASWIDFFSGDGLMNKILLLGSMGENLMMAGLGVEKLGKSLKNFAANKSGGWAEWFAGSDGVIEGFKELSKIGTPEFVSTAEAVHKMGDGMDKIQKIHSVPMIHTMAGDATTATVPVGTSAGSSSPTTGVEPVHLRDITGTILRDRAGATGNRLQSDELSRMEEASNRQVSELEQIRQGIQELVSLMRPRGGVVGSGEDSGAARTKDPRRPMHAAKFGKMKYGKMGGSPNRSFVNNGEV